jgi:CHAD domain-containing protein
MARTSSPEQLVLDRLRAVDRWLPDARKHDVDAVHRARVATRRLREALPVLASGKTKRAAGKSARRLTRALGSVRELDVAMQTLDQLDTGGEVPRAAVTKLRSLIAQERRGLRLELKRELDRVDVGKLKDRAGAAARKAAARGREPARDRQLLTEADVRCGRRAVKLRAAIEGAAGIYLPDRLHQVRIAVKKLRYAMELAYELRGVRTDQSASRTPKSAAGRLHTLRDAQDLLGRMHDLDVLIARTRALQGSAAVPTLRMSGDLDLLVRRLENECRQLHARYMTSRAGVLAVCDQAEATASRHRRNRSAA